MKETIKTWLGRFAIQLTTRVALIFALVLVADWYLYPGWAETARNDQSCELRSSSPSWTTRRDGLETSVVSIICDGATVDRMHLVRLDQEKYELDVHYSPKSPKRVEDWQRSLDAVAIINGSFYLPNRSPETPIKSQGSFFGPKEYVSQHGAIVIGEKVEILDLNEKIVSQALEPYSDAMVSYPLLLDDAQTSRAAGKAHWIANRTFVAIDVEERVIFGTTEKGFFSLRRLGSFLEQRPFGIMTALNLDGGPVATQMVKANNYEKIIRGRWETNDRSTRGTLIAQSFRSDSKWWKLPIVLSAVPRVKP